MAVNSNRAFSVYMKHVYKHVLKHGKWRLIVNIYQLISNNQYVG